jgi:membrane carboxypeptidase/penicillin-binding protein PbpC
MTYFVVSHDQQLALQASSGLEVREHMWYVDEKYLGRRKAGEKLFVAFQDGEHLLSCLDDKGRLSSVHFTVKFAMVTSELTQRTPQ